MKTPLQEFIEIIKKRQEDDEALPFMYNTQIIELAESLLEKEKEQIADAWELGKCLDGFNGEEYYNRTFNTKKK